MILLITFNIGLYVPLCLGYMFTSGNTNAIIDTRIPVLFDIYNTQTLPYSLAPITGVWATSFLTQEPPNANATSDPRQYFLVSGILDSQSISTYGVSILDLSTDERWMYFYPATFTDTHLETFNFSIPGYEFSDVSADKTSQMRLYSSREGVECNITLHATTPAFYYDGTGAYNYVDGIMYNWAFPAMKTTGMITIPDENENERETVQINGSNSLTWYDRVWGASKLRNCNSIFFSLYFENSDLVLFAPLVDSYDPVFWSRSANTRLRNRLAPHTLVPVSSFDAVPTRLGGRC